MTNEIIVPDQTLLLFAFSKDEREHIMLLADTANNFLSSYLQTKNKDDKKKYQSIKYALKQMQAIGKDDLKNIKQIDKKK